MLDFGDLVASLHLCRDDDDAGGAEGFVVFALQFAIRYGWHAAFQGVGHQCTKGRALVFGDDDEMPGAQASVIRRTDGAGKNLLQFLGRGAG